MRRQSGVGSPVCHAKDSHDPGFSIRGSVLMSPRRGERGIGGVGASAALPVQPSLEGVPAVPDYPPLCLQTKSGVEPFAGP